MLTMYLIVYISSSQWPHEVDIIVPILQMCKLRFRKIE